MHTIYEQNERERDLASLDKILYEIYSRMREYPISTFS